MEQAFITDIHIKQVRHLKDISIHLSDTERKHLILTGKNGSGKTSVLEKLNVFLRYLGFNLLNDWDNQLPKINELRRKILDNSNKDVYVWVDEIHRYEQCTERMGHNYIKVFYSNNEILQNTLRQQQYITCYIPAKRDKLPIATEVKTLEVKEQYDIDEVARNQFVQYIINQRTAKAYANEDNDIKAVEQINKWFEVLENALKKIFETDNLKLEFERKNGANFSFQQNVYIAIEGRERFLFNELSDGYAAILDIVTELMMRMETKSSLTYDMQGVVLIDEIETHLHIDLQKKILPFLTTFFPNIQFIVTTHSPFVINSIDGAVVYDLEKNYTFESNTGYSVEAIIENYFDSDKYSEEIKHKVDRYEQLIRKKKDLSDDEMDEYITLKKYFKNLPKLYSSELSLKIDELELLSAK